MILIKTNWSTAHWIDTIHFMDDRTISITRPMLQET